MTDFGGALQAGGEGLWKPDANPYIAPLKKQSLIMSFLNLHLERYTVI
jgi:hypothetical protein